MKIIILSGKMGSGKTTISNHLKLRAKQLGFEYIGVEKFASVLYELHDILLNKMETYTGKPRLKKDGTLLQLLGTEWGRKQYGEDVWANILKNKIYKNDSSKKLVIIDDCRFENEFNAFPEALRVRLKAPEEERKKRADAWRENTNHPSETGLDEYEQMGKFDVVLYTGNNIHSVDDNINHCVSLIMSELQRGSWMETRK